MKNLSPIPPFPYNYCTPMDEKNLIFCNKKFFIFDNTFIYNLLSYVHV